MPDTVTYGVLKAGIYTFVSSVISGGECCTRFYLNIDVDVECTVTVKQFDFIILLLMFFNRINPVMSLKQ
jgi:hypothetical protein